METEVPIQTPAGSMRTFIVHPDGDGPFPVAVIYMDAPGYREALRDTARRYAQAGYLVVVPDLYHAAGENITIDIPKIMEQGVDGPEGRRLFELARGVTPELGASYTRALLDRLAGEPHAAAGPRVCLGFCMGARHVLHTMATFPDDFAAGVGIHPGVLATGADDSPHLELARVRGELYLGLAEVDEASTPEVVAALEDEARRDGTDLRIEIYPGTHHGFAMPDTPAYHEQGSELHYERTLEIWARHV